MTFSYDIECLPNYFLIGIHFWDTGEYFEYDLYNDRGMGGKTGLREAMKLFKNLSKDDMVVTVNGINYDHVMIQKILDKNVKVTNEELFQYSQWIIGKLPDSPTGLDKPRVYNINGENHIDLAELMGFIAKDEQGMVSLKQALGIMCYPRILEYDVDWNEQVDAERRKKLQEYCKVDTLGTTFLAECFASEIEDRQILTDTFGVDVRTASRSRAGIKIICDMYKQEYGISPYTLKEKYWGNVWNKEAHDKRLKKDKVNFIDLFPDYMIERDWFISPEFVQYYQQVLEFSRTLYIEKDKSGNAVNKLDIHGEVNGFKFSLKEGGLHDENGPGIWKRKRGWDVVYLDVKSYYPKTVEVDKIDPRHLPGFSQGMASVTDFRLKQDELGRQGNEKAAKTAKSTKIVINAGFGNLGYIGSPFYDPLAVIRVTVPDQIKLLILIDWAMNIGAEILHANTDGIGIKIAKKNRKRLDKMVAYWMECFNLTLEQDELSKLVKLNANSYILVDTDGKVIKSVKDFKTRIVNPKTDKRSYPIIAQALVDYLASGKTIEDTIAQCDDLHEFSRGFKANGSMHYYRIDGAQWAKAQKVVRVYQALRGGELGTMRSNSKNVTKQQKCDSVRLCLDIDDPSLVNYPDINRQWYIDEAYSIIEDLKPFLESKK